MHEKHATQQTVRKGGIISTYADGLICSVEFKEYAFKRN